MTRWIPILAATLCALTLARPIDHDESQYIAAAVLARQGLPYRDFAYLQMPLQPMLFAPITALLGMWTYPGLRMVNALLGTVAVFASYKAMRVSGARACTASACAGLFATCDILLFAAGTARNDILPCAFFSIAIWFAMTTENGGGSRGRAIALGMLLAAAAASKISYAIPALAFGVYSFFDRRHRPAWLALGAAPVAALVAWLFWLAPEGFVFGVFEFPARAPAQYFLMEGRASKLALWSKGFDALKFLALGPALVALVLVARDRRSFDGMRFLELMIMAALVAALLPMPTWRQYLLPILPPLFVRLAMAWTHRAPSAPVAHTTGLFALIGLTPSVLALTVGLRDRLPMVSAIRQGAAIRQKLDHLGVHDPIATLSPQFLPATGRLPDYRFATGPFYFRSRGLLSGAAERRLGLVSATGLSSGVAVFSPCVVLVGGEGGWTSGEEKLDRILEADAVRRGARAFKVDQTNFRLYVLPPACAATK